MSFENPTILNENCIAMVGQEDACNLAASGGDEKKLTDAVPTGKDLIVTHVVLDEFSAEDNVTPAVLTFGKYGGDCNEWLGDQTISSITSDYANEAIVLRPTWHTSVPVHSLVLHAGEFFAMEITTADGGSLTARISTFGFYKNA